MERENADLDDQWYEQLFPDIVGVENDDPLPSPGCSSSDGSVVHVERDNKHDYALKSPECDAGQPKKCVFQISKVLPVMEVKPEGFKKTREGTSSDDDGHHMTKNAIAARENRMKKKRYIQGLEKSVSHLGAENNQLRQRLQKMESRIVRTDDEVAYLRGILANVEEISELVRGIRSTTSLKVKTSLGKRSPSLESDNEPERKKPCNNSPGVCLHVSEGEMSLEFCRHCSRAARE